jgi:hypothetical protein
VNIYLLRKSRPKLFDSLDFCVVVAKTAKDAKNIHPYDGTIYSEKSNKNSYWYIASDNWKHPNRITATLVGKALDSQEENSIICSSFN